MKTRTTKKAFNAAAQGLSFILAAAAFSWLIYGIWLVGSGFLASPVEPWSIICGLAILITYKMVVGVMVLLCFGALALLECLLQKAVKEEA